MAIVLFTLASFFRVLGEIFEKKKKIFSLCSVCTVLTTTIGTIIVAILGTETYFERYAIPVHNVQNFQVIMTEASCIWVDGHRITYIVSNKDVEVKPFPDDELRLPVAERYYNFFRYRDWARIWDFGIFTKSSHFVSTTYYIECPESQVIVSQKSNSERKWPYI